MSPKGQTLQQIEAGFKNLSGRIGTLFEGPKQETEFLPAALEIIEQPPSPASRAIAGLIMAFLLIALLWASFGSVDLIATAQGKIVPTGRTKVIQPFETGVVRTIHVQDGQAVKAGDVLVEIDATINEAERDRLQKEWIEQSLTAARLRAVFANDPMAAFKAPEGATESQIATQQSLLQNQVQEIHAKLGDLDEQIKQHEGNLAAVRSTVAKLTESLPYLKKRAQAREELMKKGYGAKLEYLETKQDLIEHEQELNVQEGRLAEAEGSLSSLWEQRKQAEAEYKRTVLNDLAEAEQKATSLQEQVLQAAQKFRLQTLTAPVDGTVQQVAIHTEGGVVTPAQTLMAIVPADSHLEVEAMIPNKDIGFVKEGQEAAIKIDTFNFTKYGLLHGRVLTVSRDAILHDQPAAANEDKKRAGDETDSSDPNGQELVYSARLALKEKDMMVDGRNVALLPGMAVTAEIKTGSEHVIDYLLSPLQKHIHGAMRER